MLELAILGLLKEQELHGYELKKRLAETVGSGISFGSLYPALNRLTTVGALHVVVSGASVAKSDTRGSRGKKVYGITDHGEQLFDELLAGDTATSEDERSFNLRLAFARHLTRDARIGMMERRRAFLLERLARTKVSIRTGWGRFDAYTRSLMEHGNETTERDICWLDRLIERERTEGVPPSASEPASGPEPAPVPEPASPAVALASWAASTAPTMPARPMVHAAPRPVSAPVNEGPAPSAPTVQQPAPPAVQQPVPPAIRHGGNIA